jgi:uncharacterized protein (UPF0248 family)
MAFPKEVLNRLKWGPSSEMGDAEIHYLHRGAPNDTKVIKGNDIVELERSFFITEDGTIPYHRIRKIVHRGRVLYESERPTLNPNARGNNRNREETK